MEYIVFLEIRIGGAACGSTEDVVEASDAAAAEAHALRAWCEVMPNRTFAPLLTLASTNAGRS